MISPTFKLDDAYQFAKAHGLQAEASAIRDMAVHSDIRRPVTVRKGHLVELFTKNGLMDQFVAQHWPGRFTPGGESRYAVFVKNKAVNESLLRGEIPDEDGASTEVAEADIATPTELASFELEGQLRDFIAHNLSRIPISGRSLGLYTDQAGQNGMEYGTDVGRIDILTVDKAGDFFVFELKLERGPDRALGQLARYMGWIKAHLAGERQVFGVLVAKSIDEKLKYAVKVMPNVSLLEYEVEFRLKDASSVVRGTS